MYFEILIRNTPRHGTNSNLGGQNLPLCVETFGCRLKLRRPPARLLPTTCLESTRHEWATIQIVPVWHAGRGCWSIAESVFCAPTAGRASHKGNRRAHLWLALSHPFSHGSSQCIVPGPVARTASAFFEVVSPPLRLLPRLPPRQILPPLPHEEQNDCDGGRSHNGPKW